MHDMDGNILYNKKGEPRRKPGISGERKRKRTKKAVSQKKVDFVKQIRRGLNITQAAAMVDWHPSTFNYHVLKDEVFAQKVTKARAELVGDLVDVVRDSAASDYKAAVQMLKAVSPHDWNRKAVTIEDSRSSINMSNVDEFLKIATQREQKLIDDKDTIDIKPILVEQVNFEDAQNE